MRKERKIWIFMLLLMVLSIAGGLIGEILSQFDFFAWMSLGGENGYRTLFDFSFQPLVDFFLFEIDFGMVMRINFGSIVGMLVAVLIYR